MAFENIVPVWNAAGTEPPEDLKNSGFAAGYKPPAGFFNWFWNGMSKAAQELQDYSFKTYTSLEEIGIEGGTETLLLIAEKMPFQSKLVLQITSDKNANIYPAAYGMLQAVKQKNIYNRIQVAFRFFAMKDQSKTLEYIAYASGTTDLIRICDWEKIAKTDELSEKAPTSHAASTTTYGAGTGSNYGHVKLSDSTSSTSDKSGGVAATPAAVKAAYDLANGKANSSHNQAASTITAGTFAGRVQGNAAAMATPGNAQFRDIKASTTDLTAGVSELASGQVYLVYE